MTAIPKAEMNMAPDRFKALDPMFRNSDPNLQTLVKEVAGWAQLTVDRERKLDEDSRERHEIVKQAIEENRNVRGKEAGPIAGHLLAANGQVWSLFCERQERHSAK